MVKRWLAAGLVCGLASLPTSVATANDFKFDQYSRNVGELNGMILGFCGGKGARFLDTRSIVGPLSDPDNFRAACGRGLDGKALDPGTLFYFSRTSAPAAIRDVLGVIRLIKRGNKRRLLVHGWETRVQRRHEEPAIRSERPVAILFRETETGLEPVWNYVHPVKGDWYRPQTLAPETQNLDGATAGYLDDIWRRDVTIGFGRFLWALRDSRGTGFP